MRKSDGVRQLGDAIDLLAMVEQLVDGFSRNESQQIPWRGLRLTLSQVRSLLLRTHDLFAQEPVFDDSVIQESNVRRPPRVSSPLAGRVQKAPVTGRIREIADPFDSAEPFGGRNNASGQSATGGQNIESQIGDELPAAVGEI